MSSANNSQFAKTMKANNSQFVKTKKMFCDHLYNYPKHPTFEEWSSADPEDMAALLFVAFYQEITLAWYNAIVAPNVVYINQDDGVSTVLQYLTKNVPKILDDPTRYNEKYIYRISYNCLGGLRNTRGWERHRSLVESSNEVEDGGTMRDLWELIPSDAPDLDTVEVYEAIEDIIAHMGPKAEKVVNHLINPHDSLGVVPHNLAYRSDDRLADVSVSKSEYASILAELRERLAPFKHAILT